MNNEKSLVNALIDMSKPKEHDNINSIIQNNRICQIEEIKMVQEDNSSNNKTLDNTI